MKRNDAEHAPILVTGSAGFIGFHVAQALLNRGEQVIGLDAFTPFYEKELKVARSELLEKRNGFTAAKINLLDRDALEDVFVKRRPRRIIHLAAAAGVRDADNNADTYLDDNLRGFHVLLEACRRHPPKHLTFASTSAAYGASRVMPFRETEPLAHPLSLYAATKIANEAVAHSYAHLYGIPVTAARFFTVYGPWGRPDMALFTFAKAMRSGKPIDVYNHGDMTRDFTYVDDLVDALLAVADSPPSPSETWKADRPEPGESGVAPFRVYNIGGGNPETLDDYIVALEEALGISAKRNLMPMQPGDMKDTASDDGKFARKFGRRPRTPLKEGVARFADWYVNHYEPLIAKTR